MVYGVPKSLESKWVSEFSLEMLDMDALFEGNEKCSLEDDYLLNVDGLPSNHSICSLKFEPAQHTPEDYKGVRIDLEFSGRQEPIVSPGELNVAPYSHEGPHKRTVKTVRIPIRGRKTVGDFLQVLEDNKMIPCDFITETGRVRGCKDFLSQFVYRLDEAQVLDVSTNSKEVYETFFNGVFGPGLNERRHGGVDYAAFNATYHARHHPIRGIDYKGNRISLDSVERCEWSDSE